MTLKCSKVKRFINTQLLKNKTCVKCQRTLPNIIENFFFRNGYLEKICKECQRKKKRKQYVKHSDQIVIEKKQYPERFCLKCGIRFNGILKIKPSKENIRICERCICGLDKI